MKIKKEMKIQNKKGVKTKNQNRKEKMPNLLGINLNKNLNVKINESIDLK